MSRVDDVAAVVAPLLRDDPASAVRTAATTHDHETWAGFVAFWCGHTPELLEHAGRAAARADHPDDPLGRVLALAVVGLARSRSVDDVLADPFDEIEHLLHHEDVDDPAWAFARYLAAEAALTCALVGRALVLLPTDPRVPATWHGSGVEVLMRQLWVRVPAFSGRIDEARDRLEALERVADAHGLPALATGLRALVLGNADGRGAASVHDLLADVGQNPVRPDHFGRGSLLLAAFGAVATGDVRAAATLVLRAGGDADLSALTVIDRALGLELLLALAELDGDLEAAQAWSALAAPLGAHRTARPTVLRMRARVAAMAGEADAAVSYAEQAVAEATREGRVVEAAEAQVVLARAHLLARHVKEATRGLRVAVHEADTHGHGAVRRSASQVLSTAGRRLPPVSAGGWDALSPRERDVAGLVLQGLDQRAIAEELFLSPGTVRVHVSRVLCAFGVGTRVGLLAVAGPRGDDPGRDPAALTPRQRDVVALLARGLSNVEVAADLEVSVKAVEKHVSDSLRRWGVASRFELARQWLRAESSSVEPSPSAHPSPSS